jgi:hypothetical protein
MDDTESDEEYEQLQLPGMEDPKYSVTMQFTPDTSLSTSPFNSTSGVTHLHQMPMHGGYPMPHTFNTAAVRLGFVAGMAVEECLNIIATQLEARANEENNLRSMVWALQSDKALLQSQIDELTARQAQRPQKPGRKAKLMVQTNSPGVCGLDPDRDDTTCPDAGVYRYQQGCKGTACVAANTAYYANRRRQKDVTDME